MTQEKRNLLLKDLCGRLPYGVKANVSEWDEEKQEEVNIPLRVYSIDTDGYLRFESNDYGVNGIEHFALFLRPLSSMTEEEREEYNNLYYQVPIQYNNGNAYRDTKMVEALHIDWLNRNMFDYRELIPKGLALEAPEGMYNN